MSSNAFEATLDLAPRPSARALAALFWLHAVPVVLLMLALEPGVPMTLLGLGIGGSWMALRRHPVFGYGPRALARLTWHAAGGASAHGWTLQEAGGAKHEAELLGDSIVHARLLVLNFRLAGGTRRTRVLLGDELPEEQLRRLRARLALTRRQAS